jgi:hypothetical protein
LKYSAIPAAAKDEIRAQTGISDFKSFVFLKNVALQISNNKLEAQQREVIHLDHLWVHLREWEHLMLYEDNKFFGQIVLYQRNNSSLSLGTICTPSYKWDLTRGLAHVDTYTESGFFADMDCLTRCDLDNYSLPERARIINQLCDDALSMVDDGTLHLEHLTAVLFADGMQTCWRNEWMILAGVKGTVNRAGRRVRKPRLQINSGQRQVKSVGLPPTHRVKSVRGFG